MAKKTSLRSRFLRAWLLMLVLSLLVGMGITLIFFCVFVASRAPDGWQYILSSLLPLLSPFRPTQPNLAPIVFCWGALMCLCVAVVCIALTSRLTAHFSHTLSSLRQAADRLREGDLDFEILACDTRELDELSQALESVRQRLKKSAAADAAAGEERGLLMANLSHDLRTPITTIKGYVEGIRDGVANTPEKQKHYLDIIYRKSQVMERLVGQMRDFSEYELGRMQYHFAYVELAAFLSDLAEEYADDARQSGLTFTARLPEGPLMATADGAKLKRVLDNLVSNAVKYSRPGGTIALTAEKYEAGLVIQVSDNGRGISAQALHHVFDSFYREDAARSGSVPGSGLGLAICRSIAESHHGKIWLTSEEGEGTRAFLYLPLHESKEKEALA